jgi:predicted GIY-YIG superfamily endonuclease
MTTLAQLELRGEEEEWREEDTRPPIMYLYRHWDAEGRLLYIGITHYLQQRAEDHIKAQRPWLSQVARVSVEEWATREDSADAEREAIRTEQPIWNRTYKWSKAHSLS